MGGLSTSSSSSGYGGSAALGEVSALQQFGFSFSDAALTGAALTTHDGKYASDPNFAEFRIQPAPIKAVHDKTFLIVSETNFAFAGLACNWLRSVKLHVGEAVGKYAYL